LPPPLNFSLSQNILLRGKFSSKIQKKLEAENLHFGKNVEAKFEFQATVLSSAGILQLLTNSNFLFHPLERAKINVSELNCTELTWFSF